MAKPPLKISNKLSRNDLIHIINGKSLAITQLKSSNLNKMHQIRYFRIRLLKIKREVDNIVMHPWSVKNSERK